MPARYGRLGKTKVYDFKQDRHGQYYRQKKEEVWGLTSMFRLSYKLLSRRSLTCLLMGDPNHVLGLGVYLSFLTFYAEEDRAVAGPFQLQKQRASGHILDAAACVAPVPPAAKLFAEPGSAPVAMFSQEPLDQPDILGAQFPSLYHHDACHGSYGTA